MQISRRKVFLKRASEEEKDGEKELQSWQDGLRMAVTKAHMPKDANPMSCM